jgi:alkanesulfonate monooxygenase SsuD/methylene tetrahydromethanopterin reductase-like flavin-dependent oxidoreductase (luciferase family)
MIEGQEDVSWADWLALAAACERGGVGTMFRSDHYLTVVEGSGRGALDAWGTITALGAVTETLRLGTLVSPATFRHPSVLAKTVTTADHVSGGRVELGIGAGWSVPEHEAYGFTLGPLGERMSALEEQCEIVCRHWEGGAFSFAGEHYRTAAVEPLPAPLQEGGPPLILGGAGKPRSARLAARVADEYNVPELTSAECAAVRGRLDRACEAIGRDPATLPLSVMTSWIVGADQGELDDRLARLAAWEGAEDAAAYRESIPASWIVGTVEEVRERVAALEAAGVARVMAQQLLHHDLDAVELLGREFAGTFTPGRRPTLSPR